MKTNAMRILETLKIAYESALYDDDEEHDLALGAAVRAAEKVGADAASVFKTIVMRTDANEICVFCVPAPSEVNLKKARAAAGAKEIKPVKPSELLALTGYVRGGCSPVGMKKEYRTFFDETVLLHDAVYVSAGHRGIQLKLAPSDLVLAAHAETCDLIL